MVRGQIDVACEQFAQSERLDPAPGTLINLADCEERRGHYATAWQSFHDASPMFRKGDSRVAYAEKRARALESRVPHVVLLLRGQAGGLTIYRDDVELGVASLGVSLPIDPGRHRFTVRGQGHEESKVDADILPGESRSLVLEIGRPLPGPAPLPAPYPERMGTVPQPPAPATSDGGLRSTGTAHGRYRTIHRAPPGDTWPPAWGAPRCSRESWPRSASPAPHRPTKTIATTAHANRTGSMQPRVGKRFHSSRPSPSAPPPWALAPAYIFS
ncbi:MAG TPA: hypothetical protein VNO21_02925 [Polyangiaceae bacterium]|nr:hypothetical protein [Polyangiaceae bacterium]